MPGTSVDQSRSGKQSSGETGEKRLILAVCCMALLIAAMDNTVVNVALPTIQRQLSASPTGLQWVVDAYVLVLASLLLTSGALGDRIGRRRVFQTGLIIFAAASFACSLAPSLGTLIAFRAAQGVGGSMLTPTTLSIVTNAFTDEKERARAIGIWSATSGVSIGFGPIIGGALVEFVDWRSVFWINLPICAVAFALAARYVPESKADEPRRIDIAGQATAALALASLTYGLINAPISGWSSLRTVVPLVLAGMMGLGFVYTETKKDDPLLELEYFKDRVFSISVTVAFVAFEGLFAFIFFNTLYLQEVLGYSALRAGLFTMAATGLIVFTAPVSGRIVASRGPRIPIALSCLMLGAGLVLQGFNHKGGSLWVLVAGYVVLGIGVGLVNPPITNGAVSAIPREQAGVASATTSTARQIGGVFGVAMIGSIVFGEFRSALSAAGGHDESASGGLTVNLTHLPSSARSLADSAFTSAIHQGFFVAAGLIFLAGCIGFFVIPSSP